MERHSSIGREENMNNGKTNPPGLAIWFLRHACPGDNEPLAGDLIERFREGQTPGWFWRQVFIAFIVSVRGEIRRHWPHFCYAIAATVLTWFLGDAPGIRRVPNLLHWGALPWPWSQLVAELSRPALLALAALSILAAGLVIERSFRWISLLRTAALSLALIAFGHYSIDLFPWLLRPVPGDPSHKFLIVSVVVPIVLSFFMFLAAAWMGCLSPAWRGDEFQRRPANP
jgi:hypothetical protein